MLTNLAVCIQDQMPIIDIRPLTKAERYGEDGKKKSCRQVRQYIRDNDWQYVENLYYGNGDQHLDTDEDQEQWKYPFSLNETNNLTEVTSQCSMLGLGLCCTSIYFASHHVLCSCGL